MVKYHYYIMYIISNDRMPLSYGRSDGNRDYSKRIQSVCLKLFTIYLLFFLVLLLNFR